LLVQKFKERMPELMNQLENINKKYELSKTKLNEEFAEKQRIKLENKEIRSQKTNKTNKSKLSQQSKSRSNLNRKYRQNDDNQSTISKKKRATSQLAKNIMNNTAPIPSKSNKEIINDIFKNNKLTFKNADKHKSNILLPGNL